MNERCKICGSSTRVLRHENFDVDYYCCDDCGFIAKDEVSIVTPDQELKIYEQHNNSIEDPVYVEYFVKFLDAAVFPYRSDGRKGLDFGSGPSPVLAMLLERDYGYSMDIYDLFYSSDKSYVGKTYDLVTCTEVVEHLKDPLLYFTLFRELVKEDGILAVMTQFHPEDDQKFMEWHYMRDMSHISFYTPKTMDIIADRVGLVVEYCDRKKNTTFRKK